MDLDLTARKALVTGSTDGVGSAVARELCDLGAEVGVNARLPFGRGDRHAPKSVARVEFGGDERLLRILV